MPTYEYLCENCGTFEVIQKITEPALTNCPACGAPAKRQLAPAAFVLKGTGWYKTDYASGNGRNGSGSPKSNSTPGEKAKDNSVKDTSSSTDTSEKKPEAKTPTSTSSSSGTSE